MATTLARGVLALAVPAGNVAWAQPRPSSGDKARLDRFERQVESVRGRLKIPGLSVAIVKDRELLWAKGFGFADLENRVPATADTLYPVASLTKTFAATLVMQLVEQGKLDLDEPVSRYSTDFKDDSVRIKHLLSHTSSGTPGERFQYSGQRYDSLTAVIEKNTGKRFVEVVVETFFDPLGMSSSVPYHNVVDDVSQGAGEACLGRHACQQRGTRRARGRGPGAQQLRLQLPRRVGPCP